MRAYRSRNAASRQSTSEQRRRSDIRRQPAATRQHSPATNAALLHPTGKSSEHSTRVLAVSQKASCLTRTFCDGMGEKKRYSPRQAPMKRAAEQGPGLRNVPVKGKRACRLLPVSNWKMQSKA